MKVYDLPNLGVSELWIEETHPERVRQCYYSSGSVWVKDWGPSGETAFAHKGRWLPVTLPTFPEREKAEMRLGTGIIEGERRQFVYLRCNANNPVSAYFRHAWHNYDELPDDIEWLTPEFVDELPKGTP